MSGPRVISGLLMFCRRPLNSDSGEISRTHVNLGKPASAATHSFIFIRSVLRHFNIQFDLSHGFKSGDDQFAPFAFIAGACSSISRYSKCRLSESPTS
jgi:hypothetical protein